MDADRDNSTKPSVRLFLYYAALGLLPVWLVAGYILYDSQYGLTAPWFLFFLPLTIFMAAVGFGAHLSLRRSFDTISVYAIGTAVYFSIPLIAILLLKVL